MLSLPILAASGVNWVWVAAAVVALAVVWFVVRALLKITLKIFAMGCLGILILAGLAFVLVYWR